LNILLLFNYFENLTNPVVSSEASSPQGGLRDVFVGILEKGLTSISGA